MARIKVGLDPAEFDSATKHLEGLEELYEHILSKLDGKSREQLEDLFKTYTELYFIILQQEETRKMLTNAKSNTQLIN